MFKFGPAAGNKSQFNNYFYLPEGGFQLFDFVHNIDIWAAISFILGFIFVIIEMFFPVSVYRVLWV